MAITTFGGKWTKDKLEILASYLDTYTTALKNQPFNLIYVDAFAGSGSWNPKSGYSMEEYGDFRELLKGSASIALDVQDKPFDRLIFIERDPQRSESLEQLRVEHRDRRIEVINDDANVALPGMCADMAGNDRAVVFLDPYATEVSWETVKTIAETGKIDCWILFPLMAITRMMPRNSEPTKALSTQLNRIFGGREHWQDFYTTSKQLSLLGDELPLQREVGSSQIADCYRRRLKSVFQLMAPTSRTFLNSKNSPMFELFFAASNPHGAPIAVSIADHILKNL